MEHQGPVSCPCIWPLWAVVKCHSSTSSKLQWESWAGRQAQVHRFKQGTNISSTIRLWPLFPPLCRGKQDLIPKGKQQEGQSTVVTEPCSTHCLLEQMGARDWRCAMTTARTFFQFPLLSLLCLFPLPPLLSFLWDCKHTSVGPSTRTESKPKGVDTPFHQRSKSFLFEN